LSWISLSHFSQRKAAAVLPQLRGQFIKNGKNIKKAWKTQAAKFAVNLE